MGDVVKFDPSKWQANKTCEQDPTQRVQVYTCKCGCQIFQIYDFGAVTCIACGLDRPSVEVFS